MKLLKCTSHHVEAIEAHVSIRKSITYYFPRIYPLRLHPIKGQHDRQNLKGRKPPCHVIILTTSSTNLVCQLNVDLQIKPDHIHKSVVTNL